MENPNLKIPTYSVIVLIYNRTEQLRDMAIRCVESVKKHSEDYELIVVDNASTVRHEWDCDTYIRLKENMGCSGGWNVGLKASRGKYKVILGDDTEVTANWLPKMAEAFQNESCGVVNPYVEHLGQGIGIKEDYKWFSGACFMLTQDTIDKVGYFRGDLYYPSNYEDWDYWFRVYKANLKCFKNFSVKVKHLEGQTSNASDIASQFPQNRANFIKEWGIDPTPVFCGDQDMPFS